MLLNRNKYTESGYISEDFIGEEDQQLVQRCLAVRQSLRNRDFASYEEAIKAYYVSHDEYTVVLNKPTI